MKDFLGLLKHVEKDISSLISAMSLIGIKVKGEITLTDEDRNFKTIEFETPKETEEEN